MRENLNINMLKVYVNYKTLFIERQYIYIYIYIYIYMSLAQGSFAVATSSRENLWIT